MTESINNIITVSDVAKHIGGKIKGKMDLPLTGIKPLKEATESDLSFLHRDRFLKDAQKSRAGAIIVHKGVKLDDHVLIVVNDASEGYRKAINLFYPEVRIAPGISPHSIVEDSVILGDNTHIGPRVIVGSGSTIGNNVSIMAGAIIGEGCRIGNESTIYSGAVLYPGVTIGKRVIIHANAVIGADGFGFHRSKDGKLHRVRQVGSVVIENDVEVGACTCIDRSTLTETRIGIGSKLDNLVLIGHNVQVGNDCLIIGQTGIAGSTHVGAGSNLYGQVGVRGHLQIGKRTTVLARGCVFQNTLPDSVVAGFPAMPAAQWRKVVVLTKQLPELFKDLKKQLKTKSGR